MFPSSGEYSTYMTEKQKLMTIRFLTELLVHKESDIRNQAGEVIGLIIAHFNEEYKKSCLQVRLFLVRTLPIFLCGKKF